LKVLLTGATGYLGSHLARYLIKNNFEVVILKRKTSSMKRLLGIKDVLKCYDINSYDFSTIFKEQVNFDAIIHTSTCYGRRGEHKKKIFEANTLFPTKLLETAILYKTKTFINTDTYYNVDNNISENLTNYILSKKKFLDNAKSFSLKKKIKLINLRLEHVYGPKDSETKFVNWLIDCLLRGDKKIKLTKGEQKRDMIFIDDVVDAYGAILSNLKKIDLYFSNIGVGCGETITLREFAELALKLSKSNSELIFGGIPYNKNEIMESKADNKILKDFNWNCSVYIRKGLSKIIKSI
jgi:nucleoside-diphosphate-sugar epimerase